MRKRFCGKNRSPFRNRWVSCAALGLYAFALVVIPVLHEHECDHPAEACCEHSEPVPHHPDSDDSCSICEFATLAVPFVTVAEPLLWQVNAVSEISFILWIPPVADVTDLPPCRAPPAV